jgi:hypothetical protein
LTSVSENSGAEFTAMFAGCGVPGCCGLSMFRSTFVSPRPSWRTSVGPPLSSFIRLSALRLSISARAMKNQLTNRGNLEPHRRSRQNLSALPNGLRG